MLVVVSGLPGTGKTTVAGKLAEELEAVVLSTDEIRKRVLRELGYSERKKKKVYDEMLRIARDQLGKDRNAILDGTFFQKKWRQKAFKLGKEGSHPVFLVEVICPEEVVKQRIEKRYRSKKDFSEADYRVYKIIQSQFEPIEKEHFVVNTEDKEKWEEKILDIANKMRVIERQEKVIDKLKIKNKMNLIQTHISWVLLDNENAYKVKKPVRFSFVDYSSLEKRKFFCKEEARINSRLSPGLYRGAIPITRKENVVEFEGNGETVEYAVKMVRLPQEKRMDNLLKKDKANQNQIEKIASILVGFHSDTEIAPQQFGSLSAIKDNFAPAFEIRDVVEKYLHSEKILDEVKSRVDSFMKKNKNLFSQRVRKKRIKHCHGDLRTKNIFICQDKIYIFDAIEFSRKISHCDVAADIAYLVMDLNFFGRKDLADLLVKKYIQLSGDRDLAKLINFYQCYRAMVQTLVQSYILMDPEIEEKKKEEAKQICRKYLDLAYSFALKLLN